MTNNQSDSANPAQETSVFARSGRIVAAIIIICIGAMFLIFPVATGLSVAAAAPLVLGAVGLVGICFELFAPFKEGMRFDWLVLLFSLIYLVLGIMMAQSLFDAVFVMSIVVAVGFVGQAALSAVAVFTNKGHRMWMLFLTLCSLGLAYIAFSQWPYGAIELAGICLGVSVISWGATLGWGKLRA